MHVIISKAYKQIVVPALPEVMNIFPTAPTIRGMGAKLSSYDPAADCYRTVIDAVIIPHGMRETLLLRHLGFKVPNPMLFHYDWRKMTPFEVQRSTCAMLSEHDHAYVLNDLGTGKTRSALWTYDFLRDENLAGKALVVAPLSTLNFVWAAEIFATLPHRKAVVLHGTKERRIERLNEDADIYIINHDGLKVIGDHLAARTDIDTLILDELAVYRNNSQRSRKMRDFAKRFKIVWGMTGRPMPNEPTDVWSQCKIITPSSVPKFKKQAEEILMNRVSTYKLVPKPNSVETAYSWMQPAVRYTLDDVVELPPVIHRFVDAPLSVQQQKLYDQLVKDLRIMVDQKQVTALNAGAAMSKLLQIGGGWVYTRAPDFVKLDAEPRVTALLDLLWAADRKVLLFVPFRHMLEGLAHRLAAEHISYCMVHGQTRDRDQLFNLFQNTSKYHVIAAHPECLAHGITLTAADTVIWWSPTASLDIYDQANARIRRVGQAHKQQIFHFQSTPIERRLYGLLRNKQKVQDKFLSLVEDATAGRLP